MLQQHRLELFLAHRPQLVRVANGLIGDHGRAEDIVQDAWLRFHAAALEGVLDEPVGYLYRIVRNLAVDRRRRVMLEARHVEGGASQLAERIADEAPSPERHAIVRNDLERMRAAVEALPERTRIAMEMHRFGGCKLREIADHLGISVSRTHALVAEGIDHIRQALSGDDA